jgi:short-subunit dehydrogenase
MKYSLFKGIRKNIKEKTMAKKAIVMGATSGIGMEVASLLAQRGWQVGIAGRRIDRLEEVKRNTNLLISESPKASKGEIACYQQIDVTSPEAPSLLLKLIEKLGGMDLYFHSSGIGWQNNSLDIEKEMKTVETNGLGFVRMVDTAFNWFAKQSQEQDKGQELSQEQNSDKGKGNDTYRITSIAGTKGLGAAPAYSATKRFQNHYLECLTQQAHMRHLPIAITDIRPGFVKTDLIAGSNYPLQLTPQEVAQQIVNAIERGKTVKTIDWKYSILVSLWRMIPRWIWTRLTIK